MIDEDKLCWNCDFSTTGAEFNEFECRRFPPVYNGFERAFAFPIVQSLDWCGEWKKKESP
jgi:hypothetical protein